MARTAFHPQEHGFAFVNWWVLDDTERQRLYHTFSAPLTWGTILGSAVFGPAGALLVPLGILALRGKMEQDLARGYGLCGGMCYATLDFFEANQILARGQHTNDQPVPGTGLRTYIWKRQLESLIPGAARFLAWLILLNYVPASWPFRGGARRLLAESRREWDKLKTSIDSGQPVPIGLVRETKNVFDNHQVLAIGYDQDAGDRNRGIIYLYDPNCPDRESVILLRFGEHALDGRESCGGGIPLRGFFCQHYAPSNLAQAVD